MIFPCRIQFWNLNSQSSLLNETISNWIQRPKVYINGYHILNTCLLVSFLGATPNHIQILIRCLNKVSKPNHCSSIIFTFDPIHLTLLCNNTKQYVRTLEEDSSHKGLTREMATKLSKPSRCHETLRKKTLDLERRYLQTNLTVMLRIGWEQSAIGLSGNIYSELISTMRWLRYKNLRGSNQYAPRRLPFLKGLQKHYGPNIL